jgi:heptaprenyl diphosphate synthase
VVLQAGTSHGVLNPDAALSLASVDEDLSIALNSGLAQVERQLLAAAAADDPFIAEAAGHLAAAGGKRFRPLLVLLASHFGDPLADGVIPAAVVVELTHLATLYHDDVMDEAPRRRGAPSANERWGNAVAILTGDYLFARASEILADLGPEAVRLQARTFQRLCSGQIRETIGPTADEDPVAHHLSVLGDKTGSLIATSAKFGAMLSGAPDGQTELLTRFGERIGVAFQLADDLVDITSPAAASGKTPGTDLREGVLTLAGLFALRSADPDDARLQDLLRRPLPDDAEHEEALDLLRAHEAVDLARAEALRWADEARDLLAPLPATASREALYRLCDYVVGRTA